MRLVRRFLQPPGQDRQARSWGAGASWKGSCWVTLNSECFCGHCYSDGEHARWANRACSYLQKVVSVRHKVFHYLSWWGCQLQRKTQTHRKKSLLCFKLGREQPLTFTWANKRNILTLPSWKCSAHTEVTSICLIWIQVTCIKLYIKPLQSPNQMLSFQPSSQQWIYSESSFSKCHLGLS